MNIHNGAWNWTRDTSKPDNSEATRTRVWLEESAPISNETLLALRARRTTEPDMCNKLLMINMLKGEQMTDTTIFAGGNTVRVSQELPELQYDNEIMVYLPYRHNNCTIDVHKFDGVGDALYGLGLSKGLTSEMTIDEFYNDDKLYEKMLGVAQRLAGRGGGHDKFLESIQVWFTMDMPRYFWQEFDTYRVGGSKQSESTMYTLGKTDLSLDDFVGGYTLGELESFQNHIRIMSRVELKKRLPEGFLQKRALNFNLQSLLNIYRQRKTHGLIEWRMLCKVIERLMLDILDVSL